MRAEPIPRAYAPAVAGVGSTAHAVKERGAQEARVARGTSSPLIVMLVWPSCCLATAGASRGPVICVARVPTSDGGRKAEVRRIAGLRSDEAHRNASLPKPLKQRQPVPPAQRQSRGRMASRILRGLRGQLCLLSSLGGHSSRKSGALQFSPPSPNLEQHGCLRPKTRCAFALMDSRDRVAKR